MFHLLAVTRLNHIYADLLCIYTIYGDQDMGSTSDLSGIKENVEHIHPDLERVSMTPTYCNNNNNNYKSN